MAAMAAVEGRAAGVIAPPSLANVQIRLKAPLRSRMTWGHLCCDAATQNGAAVATYMYCIPLEDDATAVRAVFGNLRAATFAITAVSIVPSTTANDYLNPTGPDGTTATAAPWSSVTFAGAGADTDNVVIGSVVRAGTVPALVNPNPLTGATNAWAPFVSDWVPVAPTAPFSGTQRWLMLRVSIPAEGYTRASAFAVAYTGNTINGGRDISIRTTNADVATTAGTVPIGSTEASSFGPLFAVQYLSQSAGVSVLSTGDSQLSGVTTTGGIANFVTRACNAISTPALPVVNMQASWSGQTSDTFYPLFMSFLPLVRPSVVVLEGLTTNEATTAWSTKYEARLSTMVAAAQNVGARVIVVTPLPRNSIGASASLTAAWLVARAKILAMQNVTVFDGGGIVGTKAAGIYDANWNAAYSSDMTHATDAGTTALLVGTAAIPGFQSVLSDVVF